MPIPLGVGGVGGGGDLIYWGELGKMVENMCAFGITLLYLSEVGFI